MEGTNVRDAVVRYLQRRGVILLPPAATISLRMRGLALYLGKIRQGRLEWVVSLGATCRESWQGKIRLLIFFYGVQMLRAGLLVTLCHPPTDHSEGRKSVTRSPARNICTP